jgi:hypothetical protein
MADILLSLGSQTLPGLSYQLLTATANNRRTLATLRESEVIYDWRFFANYFVLAKSPLGLMIKEFLCNLTLAVKFLTQYSL